MKTTFLAMGPGWAGPPPELHGVATGTAVSGTGRSDSWTGAGGADASKDTSAWRTEASQGTDSAGAAGADAEAEAEAEEDEDAAALLN